MPKSAPVPLPCSGDFSYIKELRQCTCPATTCPATNGFAARRSLPPDTPKQPASPLQMRFFSTPQSHFLLATSLAALTGCSGGGSGSAGPAGTSLEFTVRSISVVNNGILRLNEPILFSFSEAVDFSKVTTTSIQIAADDGTVATGQFTPLLVIRPGMARRIQRT